MKLILCPDVLLNYLWKLGGKSLNEKQLSFRSLLKQFSLLRPVSCMSLMFIRSLGSFKLTTPQWNASALCDAVTQNWLSKIRFFSSKVNILGFIHGLHASLHLCFAVSSFNSICLSVCLAVCPSNHLDVLTPTHFFLHQRWDTKFTYKRLSAPPHL